MLRLLEKRYPSDRYALFPQVADSTGSAGRRYADAIAFGLWPSRGLEIQGFEIKVSRADWLRELKDHGKSASVQAYCHRWWIVAGDKSIVKPEELPLTWGLLVPRGEDGIMAKVKAPLLEAKELSRNFCAAIMRRASEKHAKVKSDIFNRLHEEAYATAKKTAIAEAKRVLERENAGAKSQLKDLQFKSESMQRRLDRYEGIEKAIGVPIDHWDFKRMLMNFGLKSAEDDAAHIESRVSSLLESISKIKEASARAEAVVEFLKAADVKPSEGD